MSFTNVVVRGVRFHVTVEVLVNPEPFTVKVKSPPPATAEAGEIVVIVG